MREAVTQDGRAPKHAASHLQADPNIVNIAVKQHGLALAFASDELKRERNIVRMAVRQNCAALQCAHPSLQADAEMRALAGWPVEPSSTTA